MTKKDYNPCFQQNVCGPYGKCVNLLYNFKCDCSGSYFYSGKYCDECN